ncbi:protein of unknown function [Methylacidimicrobium sp. AP8]|nr:protein of unknown function [Methylacidimicrobium sp. AP8]
MARARGKDLPETILDRFRAFRSRFRLPHSIPFVAVQENKFLACLAVIRQTPATRTRAAAPTLDVGNKEEGVQPEEEER